MVSKRHRDNQGFLNIGLWNCPVGGVKIRTKTRLQGLLAAGPEGGDERGRSWPSLRRWQWTGDAENQRK